AAMKISGVRSRVAALPIRRPVIASIGRFETFWAVLVDVDTDEGISGSTYLWAFSQAGARAVQNILVELAEVAVGEDPFFSARLWRGMRRRTSQWGHEGLALI